MITKKTIADQRLAYLQHHLSVAALVNWGEQGLMEGNYEDDPQQTIRSILAQLGLADVKAFGPDYQDCEAMMQKLGYNLEVKAFSIV